MSISVAAIVRKSEIEGCASLCVRERERERERGEICAREVESDLFGLSRNNNPRFCFFFLILFHGFFGGLFVRAQAFIDTARYLLCELHMTVVAEPAAVAEEGVGGLGLLTCAFACLYAYLFACPCAQ